MEKWLQYFVSRDRTEGKHLAPHIVAQWLLMPHQKLQNWLWWSCRCENHRTGGLARILNQPFTAGGSCQICLGCVEEHQTFNACFILFSSNLLPFDEGIWPNMLDNNLYELLGCTFYDVLLLCVFYINHVFYVFFSFAKEFCKPGRLEVSNGLSASWLSPGVYSLY